MARVAGVLSHGDVWRHRLPSWCALDRRRVNLWNYVRVGLIGLGRGSGVAIAGERLTKQTRGLCC